MKKITVFLFLIISISLLFAQNKKDANNLVHLGISLHDKGNYKEAIEKYDKALEIDKDNIFALTEKAFTLASLKEYKKSISICKRAIKKHPESSMLENVYVTYGTAVSSLGDKEKAIEIYDEGIKKFPKYYMLHYNKGISLISLEKFDEANLCFIKAVLLNPRHASSHIAIARYTFSKEKYIQSLLAFSRFSILEPKGARAKSNLPYIRHIMKGETEKKGNETQKPTENSTQNPENDFSFPYHTLTEINSQDVANKENEVELFTHKFEAICSSMEEIQKEQHGFYWEFYAPFFIEMKQKNFIETLSYIVYASSGEKYINQWIQSNRKKVDEFFAWVKKYNWEKLETK